jgi:hypothetical protein
MNNKRYKLARIFMFIVGVLMVLGGVIILLAEEDSVKQALIEKFALFLTGGILIYLGLTWKKNAE